MVLDPRDQSIRDEGFNFVPFNRYLASPFQIPQAEETADARVSAGIPTIYQAQSGGGGGQNVLGPDTRGYIGNYKNLGLDAPMYSYTPPVYDDFPEPQGIVGRFKDKLNPVIDFGKKIGSGIMSAATGIPFLGSALEGFAGQFENRPLGAAVIDEFGNVYDEEELNKQNALGGYYTEAARSARRRTNRINAMLQRRAEGKKISEANLAELQAQEREQEAARQAAADAMQAENRDKGTGGYQAGYDSDFMEGGGGRDAAQEATSPGSSGPGGSDTMGSFMDGGIVDLVDIYD